MTFLFSLYNKSHKEHIMQNEIQNFVKNLNENFSENLKITNEKFGEYYGGKWCKICRYGITDAEKRGRSVYCFIALEDFTNKTLGSIKKGDIMKPASFAQPAKHARGNLFNADGGMGCCGPYGVAYMK